MKTKICSKCLIDKPYSDFNKSSRNKNGKRAECKSCQNKYYVKNSELIRSQRVKRYNDDPNSELSRNKEYYLKNRENIVSVSSEVRRNDPMVRLKNNLRSRTIQFFKSNDVQKNNKTFDIVGCSPQSLREHLGSQFVEGMTWDNYGKGGWHIDHIIPLSSADDEERIYELCHYSNLQPLWEEDNLKKGSKIL